MDELTRLRLEVRAELDRIADRMGEMADTLEAWSPVAEDTPQPSGTGDRIEQSSQRIVKNVSRLAESPQKLSLSLIDSARVCREMAQDHRLIQARLELLGQRLDAFTE